ncbi:unnamed protein product [Caenorhabditis bovis]|uniref:protein-tyrosine-phosphatase n=1 Tax=Caenorhabditis bovis TaxID=2654633 RepID=A0A8S1EVG9_9PELO|nr:unnamed protein product [Caenorhabditis bovis]
MVAAAAATGFVIAVADGVPPAVPNDVLLLQEHQKYRRRVRRQIRTRDKMSKAVKVKQKKQMKISKLSKMTRQREMTDMFDADSLDDIEDMSVAVAKKWEPSKISTAAVYSAILHHPPGPLAHPISIGLSKTAPMPKFVPTTTTTPPTLFIGVTLPFTTKGWNHIAKIQRLCVNSTHNNRLALSLSPLPIVSTLFDNFDIPNQRMRWDRAVERVRSRQPFSGKSLFSPAHVFDENEIDEQKKPMLRSPSRKTAAAATTRKNENIFAAVIQTLLHKEEPNKALVGPPTNVRVEATSNSSAVVQWDFEASQVDSFVVKYMHEPGNRMDTDKWTQQPIAGHLRHFEVTSLNAHKPYAFCVLAVKNNRQGPCSDPPVVLESVTPTYMVENLRVRWKTSNSVQLTWDYHGPRNVGFYVNHTGRKEYLNHELQLKTMTTPGFGQDLDEKTREYLWTNLRPHMTFTFHVGVRSLPPGARKYWPKEVTTRTDPTSPPYVEAPTLIDSSAAQGGQQYVKLSPATEEYGEISHYWIIVVPANYSAEDISNLDPIELEKLTADKRSQIANSVSLSPARKLKKRRAENDEGDDIKYGPKVKRARRATAPGAYVTARLSSTKVQQLYVNNQPFVVGDSQLYDGFTNYPLEPNTQYRLMMRVFAKNDVKKDAFEQRAPMSEKLSKMYSDSVLTEPFTTRSALRGAGQKSSPWIGACIAFFVLFSIVAMLICWWLRCNKKSPGRQPRHGSITKVALTGNIMNGQNVPGETSKLLANSTDYGRQIMNPYDQNRHMESSMDLYPLPTNRMNGYAPVPVPLPCLPTNGAATPNSSVIHPPIPIAELANHIERLRMNNNAGFQQEFESIETGQHFTWEHSSSDINKHKNRYANVAAYDHSRVVLSNVDGLPGYDYINANYIDGYDKPKSYIATQGPLPETFGDFWRMVWEEGSATIVMLTNLEERNRVKCDQYWPSRGSATYGDVQVTLLETVQLAHYTMRTMRLQVAGEPEVREIKHLQYTAWPDHGVPDHPTPFLVFLKRVKTLNSPDAGPIISHCSAGIGRTGAFIVIDCMLERLRYENTVDIYGCVTNLRTQRSYMVQTEEQYIFIHDAVLDAVNSGSTEVPASRLHQHVQALMQPTVDGISGIEMEFRHLTTLKWTNNRCQVANLPVNRSKNRVLSSVPFDSNRVILQMIPGIDGSDYINGSWIDGYKERQAYMAMQAPLNETAADFWRAIWEHNSSVIVMLVNTWERGQEQSSEYWPLETGVQVGKLVVEPIAEYNMEHYVLREFRLTDFQTNETRTVRHFQFIEWPEYGKPDSAEHFIDFVSQVHRAYSQFGISGPITVHCTSGAGRTAVFIALAIILDRMRSEHVVDVFTTVKLLRTERQNMIQDTEQYHFLYQAAFEYLASYDNFTS